MTSFIKNSKKSYLSDKKDTESLPYKQKNFVKLYVSKNAELSPTICICNYYSLVRYTGLIDCLSAMEADGATIVIYGHRILPLMLDFKDKILGMLNPIALDCKKQRGSCLPHNHCFNILKEFYSSCNIKIDTETSILIGHNLSDKCLAANIDIEFMPASDFIDDAEPLELKYNDIPLDKRKHILSQEVKVPEISEIISKIESGPNLILVIGRRFSGKTMLANLLCKRLNAEGYNPLLLDYGIEKDADEKVIDEIIKAKDSPKIIVHPGNYPYEYQRKQFTNIINTIIIHLTTEPDVCCLFGFMVGTFNPNYKYYSYGKNNIFVDFEDPPAHQTIKYPLKMFPHKFINYRYDANYFRNDSHFNDKVEKNKIKSIDLLFETV